MVKVEIYNLSKDDKQRFMTLHELKRENLSIDKSFYTKVWDADLETDLTDNRLCEKLFEELNIEHPEDFKGWSPSISDVFVLDNKPYYCDEFSFVKIEVW